MNRRFNTCDSPAGCHFAEQMSRESADAAVKKVFAILGVDVSDPESVEEFREDLRFSKNFRQLSNHGLKASVGAICVGIVTALIAVVSTRLG